MMEWIVWALVLFGQNAAHTWTSRARGSGSLWYHGVASVCSNGVWFVAQLFFLDKFLEVRASGDQILLLIVAVFYVACTVAGSVGMHYLLLYHVERGRMRVGSR